MTGTPPLARRADAPVPGPLWSDLLPARRPAPPLDGDDRADVAIVGAGFTGLWTAYYLLEADPSLDVLLVEAETVGHGASGRNGGWCSALFALDGPALAQRHGRDAALEMRAALRDTVVEVGGVAAAEQIDCGFAFGGTLTLARNRPQLERIAQSVADAATWGDEAHLLGPDELATRVRAHGVIAAGFTADCARIQPTALLRGLLDVVLARGARLVEGTRALRLAPRAVVTDHGTVRAQFVVRATEAWTTRLPASSRSLAQVSEHLIATEPLSAAVWDEIGLDQAETFTDGGHVVVRGQRTADGRIVLGGRGTPFHLRSAIRAAYDDPGTRAEHLRRMLVELFPALDGVTITHRWGGPVAVPRDRHPSVGLDDDGIGWAGGYVGDGVGAANLAGRTLADLVHGSDTPLTRLPWVGHRSPDWEPEPVRWAGIAAVRRAAAWADRTESRTGHASRLSGVVERFTG